MAGNSKTNMSAWFVVGAMIVVNALLLVLGGVLVAQGQAQYIPLFGLGTVGVTLAILGAAIMMVLEHAQPEPVQQPTGLSEVQGKEMTALLKSISDRLLISDMAKRIAYRENDREALRQAIREDIDRNDYDAALILVSEMGRTYGYRLEAEQFREEIEAARAAELNQRITQAISQLDRLIGQDDWERAYGEAAKIQRLFPDAIQVQNLQQRIEEAKEDKKDELKQQFLDAAQREDTELAMDLLKELDKYLTREEATPFMDSARQVVKKKRENLGLQFRLACTDQDWSWAYKVGEQILVEFPNSKMAEEVRTIMPKLREKAGIKTTEPIEGQAETAQAAENT